ncbi:unnamed protein product [Musa textilis]
MGKEGETSAAAAYAAVRPKVKNQEGRGCRRPVDRIRDGRGRGSGGERSVAGSARKLKTGTSRDWYLFCTLRIHISSGIVSQRPRTTRSRLSRRARRAHKNRRLQ